MPFSKYLILYQTAIYLLYVPNFKSIVKFSFDEKRNSILGFIKII